MLIRREGGAYFKFRPISGVSWSCKLLLETVRDAIIGLKKHLKDNKHNSLHLARNYVRIFVLEHYMFLKAGGSFPRTKLTENCEFLGTDNIHGQLSEHTSKTNGG